MRRFKVGTGMPKPFIDEEAFLRAARAYALKRYPNPERNGCPSVVELTAMAERRMSLADIARRTEHVATCSECLSDYFSARERWNRRQRKLIAVFATAAGLIMAVAGAVAIRSARPGQEPGPSTVAKQPAGRGSEEQLITLDLRPLDPLRGEREPSATVPVVPNANLRLTIILPAGSEEGTYEFELRDQRDSPLIRGNGIARIQNYITSIETRLDLRAVNPGIFNWAIRRADELRWRSFALEVR